MSTNVLRKNAQLKVRYEVSGPPSKLVWFPGVVDAVHNEIISVTFKEYCGFEESFQEFRLKDGRLLDAQRNIYPFQVTSIAPDEIEEEIVPGDDNITPLKEVISFSNIFSILSLKLNSAFQSVPKSLEPISQNHGFISQSVLKSSVDCSLSQVISFINSVKREHGEILTADYCPDNTYPEYININVGSFDMISKLFQIERSKTNELQYFSKYNRKGRLLQCRLIGTYSISDDNKFVLSYGGSWSSWRKGCTFTRLESSISLDRFTRPLIQVQTPERLKDFMFGSRFRNGHYFGFRWTSLMEKSVTNVHRNKNTTYGSFEVTIPYVHIRNKRFAKELEIMLNIDSPSSDSADSSDSN